MNELIRRLAWKSVTLSIYSQKFPFTNLYYRLYPLTLKCHQHLFITQSPLGSVLHNWIAQPRNHWDENIFIRQFCWSSHGCPRAEEANLHQQCHQQKRSYLCCWLGVLVSTAPTKPLPSRQIDEVITIISQAEEMYQELLTALCPLVAP